MTESPCTASRRSGRWIRSAARAGTFSSSPSHRVRYQVVNHPRQHAVSGSGCALALRTRSVCREAAEEGTDDINVAVLLERRADVVVHPGGRNGDGKDPPVQRFHSATRPAVFGGPPV